MLPTPTAVNAKTSISRLPSTDSEFRAKFGYHRDKSGLSYRELADAAHMSGAYVHDIEAGKRLRPRRDIIIRLCIAMRLDVAETDELLRLSGHPPLVD